MYIYIANLPMLSVEEGHKLGLITSGKSTAVLVVSLPVSVYMCCRFNSLPMPCSLHHSLCRLLPRHKGKSLATEMVLPSLHVWRWLDSDVSFALHHSFLNILSNTSVVHEACHPFTATFSQKSWISAWDQFVYNMHPMCFGPCCCINDIYACIDVVQHTNSINLQGQTTHMEKS